MNAGKSVCAHRRLNARVAFKAHSDPEFNRQIDYIEAKILLPK